MVIFKLTPEQKELAIKYLKKETWECHQENSKRSRRLQLSSPRKEKRKPRKVKIYMSTKSNGDLS